MFPRVPLEIHFLILANLDRQALYALCLTCKALLRATERSLFLAVDETEVHLSETTRFLSFARAVLRWPQVGWRVRELTLNTESMTGTASSRETFASFISLERSLHLGTGQRSASWWEEISSLGIGCILALLLTHTRHLEILFLMADRTELPPIIYLTRHMTGYLHTLEGLVVDCRPACNLADLSPLMGLPNLQELSCWGCIGDNPIVAGGAVEIFQAPPAVNISVLDLRECCMDERCMTALVRACPKLESLTYEATNFPDIRYTNFSPSRLREVLHSHRDQLQQLELFLDCLELGSNMELFQLSSPFDSFARLEFLEIDQIYLRDDHELPPTLRNLIISNCINPIFTFLQHVARQVDSTLRCLEFINILLPNTPCIAVLDIDFNMATEDLIVERCNVITEMFQGTNVYIHFGENIWEKVRQHRATACGCKPLGSGQ
ncbi:hypothetical protein FE257_002186 [Aspergillus nanangensis]|uniref:F-box domain-containing protein n=1 Tax=Aspergillus nanangensis TaxID=2582783 RepID=A0AAD4CD08_ASPNN|nr:hypothetical protein FE257_002186 [Aspergillus nanangensis]